MIEQQVRDRIAASADDVACAPVPLADIRSAGRALARRRTRVRVAGSAAAVVGAAVVALPGQEPGGDAPSPSTQSAQPSTTATPAPQDRRRGSGAAWTSAELNRCLEAIGEEPVSNLREALSLAASVLRECDRWATRARR